jgi:hypothetical protein
MTGNALQNIEQIESSLWEAADQLRANSKLTSSEYAMPVLGVIFLRHAWQATQTPHACVSMRIGCCLSRKRAIPLSGTTALHLQPWRKRGQPADPHRRFRSNTH